MWDTRQAETPTHYDSCWFIPKLRTSAALSKAHVAVLKGWVKAGLPAFRNRGVVLRQCYSLEKDGGKAGALGSSQAGAFHKQCDNKG